MKLAAVVSPALFLVALLAGARESRAIPPEEVEVVFELEEPRLLPGAHVASPFILHANTEVQGFTLSVDFDEELLEGDGVDLLWVRPDNRPYEFVQFQIDNQNAHPGNAGVDEGFIAASVVIGLEVPAVLPADVQNRVLEARFRVRPEAGASAVMLRFLDGAKGAGVPVRNSILAGGETITTENARSFIFVNDLICICPPDQEPPFLRGDSNGDEVLDISDPQNTLAYLFLGTPAPTCPDAADSNDDGRVDISDPVRVLGFLFLGGQPPPPPFPSADGDPTPDALGCAPAH